MKLPVWVTLFSNGWEAYDVIKRAICVALKSKQQWQIGVLQGLGLFEHLKTPRPGWQDLHKTVILN